MTNDKFASTNVQNSDLQDDMAQEAKPLPKEVQLNTVIGKQTKGRKIGSKNKLSVASYSMCALFMTQSKYQVIKNKLT